MLCFLMALKWEDLKDLADIPIMVHVAEGGELLLQPPYVDFKDNM